MLEKFRENARSTLIQVAIAAVSLVFILSFGPGSCGQTGTLGNAPTWAAVVNGETIPASTFERAYQARVDMQRQFRGGTYTNEDARADDLRAKVMQEVVDAELVAQAGERHGLYVSDEEVYDELTKVPAFQGRDGQFDPQLYRRFLAAREGVTPAKFEERLRRSLLAQRMTELALGTLTVSDDEVRTEFLKNGEGATIEYVRFSPAQFTDRVEVTDAEVAKVLADDPEAVKKRYEDTRFKYLQPRAIKARRLFVPLRQDATADEERAAREKLDGALARLKEGAKFEEVADSLDDDPAAEPGGDVGWVELGRSPYGRRFEEATFKLKPGERSEVVRDMFGFSVIEAVEERPASEKKLEEVEKEVAREVAKERKAKELAAAAARETLEKLKGGTALDAQWPKQEGAEDAAQKPQAQTTAEFHPYGGNIPGIGLVPTLSRTVFAMAGDRRIPDEVVEDGGNYYVFFVKARTRPDLDTFAEQKEQLRDRLEGQKKFALRDKWLETIREESKRGVKLNDVLLSYDRRPGFNDAM